MIELYAKGTTDFSKHGIALAAQKASVTYQDNGRYDMDMTMPYNALIAVDYGMILRCPVPKQEIGQITLGTVSYWEISAGLSDVPLYKAVPVTTTIKYDNWEYGKEYAQGDKVSYDKKNYQALTPITGILTTGSPNVLPNNWQQIARTKTTGGGVVVNLQGGDDIVKTGDFNDEYMKAADTAGHEGFIQISKCTDLSETGTRTVPAQTITLQSFTITEITKSSDGKTLAIHAEHISYQLQRTMLGECNISRANPATALMFIRGAMKESYPGAIETNLSDDLVITGDYSWKNAQAAILDPKAGILQATNGRIIRNDLNVYIIEEGAADPRYRITYGTNMKAVKWDGNVGDLVTRVYPLAQNEDGSTLLLPEEYIDTVRTVPYIRPEALNTGLKVGAKEKQEDGSEIELDIDTVYARMREAANNRFNIDECDKATITLEVDWQHLPDTAEYSAYAALMNAAPGEWVRVIAGPLGINTDIQLTGYTYDPILGRYQKGTFGKKKVSSGVASYEIQSGAVTGRTLAAGAVGGQNIQAGTITAREIEANSITADKIASRSITTELLMAGAVTADEIAAQSITTVKLAAQAVTADKIAAHSITSDQILAGGITTASLAAGAVTAEIIAASAVTTDKLAAGSVEASKIAALAITTEKLAAGAVTADKIGAGAITANKISTDDLSAIQATLQIANIANAQIESADINYAHIKDLDAQSAYFGQAVFQEALGGKLYVPRLAANYAQILNATISDLVIQASNDNYYKLDIDLSGNVTATQVTPSAAEIAQGHTNDGRTIYMGTDILADDLNTQNIYASHALMDEITANIINVDKLWAREAFINKLNVQDLSSNTYIQSVVGNWQSQSTITQTVDGINTRITTLGYGTFFYSTTAPDPAGVVVGDVWIEPIEDNTWDDIAEYTWDELGGMTWEQVAGQYRMYVWTGTEWKLLFDNMIVSQLQTQINQNAYAITLKADQSAVNTLSGEVSDFAATLEVQAQTITAAVSSVNAKTATYVRMTDPSLDSSISLNVGDTWAKSIGNGLWGGLADFTWDELAGYTWNELAGTSVYTWNGTEWLPTSNYGEILQHQTIIEQTDRQITLMAEEQEIIGDQVEKNRASITVQADRITQEVERATNAENGKISKTTQYQTADAIVSEAVSQSASSAQGLYLAKTTSYQTADAIVNEAVRQAATSASGAYIAKTSTYQTADSIKTEAVRVSGANAAALYLEKNSSYPTVDAIINQANAAADAAADTAKNASIAKTETYQSAQAIVNTAVAAAATAAGQSYIAKTSSYQTADAIVNAAEGYVDGQLVNYSTTEQTNTYIAQYVGNNAYHICSGILIRDVGIDISGSQYVAIASGGYFKVTTGDFGIDTSQNGICVWAGAAAAGSAAFRVKKDGTVYLTKLVAVAEDGTESEVNLRTANLWKLNYGTIKSLTVSGGYCTGMTFSNAVGGYSSVNFNSAASVVLSGSWSGSTFTVSNNKNSQTSATTIAFEHDTASWYDARMAINADHKVTMNIIDSDRNRTPLTMELDGTLTYTAGYNQGVSDGAGSVYVASATVASYGGYLDTWTVTVALSSGGSQTVSLGNTYTPLKALYDSGYDAGWIDGYNAAVGKVSNGTYGYVVVPATTTTKGDMPTESWVVSADVQNTAQGWYTGYAYVAGVQKALMSRQFS